MGHATSSDNAEDWQVWTKQSSVRGGKGHQGIHKMLTMKAWHLWGFRSIMSLAMTVSVDLKISRFVY